MNKKRKLTLIFSALIALMLLFSTAASSKIFFISLHLEPEIVSHDPDKNLYYLPFYLYKDAWGEYQAKVVNFLLGIKESDNDLVYINFKLTPKSNYKIDSLSFDIEIPGIAEALTSKNPETGQDNPYRYTRTEGDSFVRLDYPSLGINTGETVTIELWLDMSKLDPQIDEAPFIFSFSVHEDSIFKIANHTALNTLIRINIP